jgi:hypothetical protein
MGHSDTILGARTGLRIKDNRSLNVCRAGPTSLAHQVGATRIKISEREEVGRCSISFTKLL